MRINLAIYTISLLFFLLFPSQQSAGAEASPVALVYRQDLPLHRQLAGQINRALAEEDPPIPTVDLPLSSAWSPENEKDFADKKPFFAIAFGDVALTFCRKALPDLNGFFLLVSSQEQVAEAESSGRWTGAGLWVKPEKQLEKFRELFPGAQTIGSVVSAGFFSREQLVALRQTGERFGFALDIVEVGQRRDILGAIAQVYKRSDAFWMMPDPQLLNEITLAEMLRLQTAHARPLLGLSPRFVQLGALLSVNTSLGELAKQAVVMSRKFAGSRHQGHQGPLPDSCYIVHVNADVAAKLHFKTPAAISASYDFISPAGEEGRP
ncbi:MAG: hypothetical protein C4531_09860 [Desulfurivibrio sp.]|nr:MAG: hypothetical protein C4531_09860 [Desulfurivibrio sp.]